MDHPSSQQNSRCADQSDSQLELGKEHTATSASDSSCILPAPAKFDRKGKICGSALSVSKTKVSDISIDAQRKSIYALHRKYIHNLIIKNEASEVRSNSRDLWSSYENLFEMN